MRSGIVVDGLQANGVNHRCVTVELLTGETIIYSIEGKTTCSAIWNRVEGELVARGVVHPQIFGLAIKTGSDWVFVDPDAKVSKYFTKEWKSSTAVQNNSINESKTLVLYCRVHFYLDALPQNFDVVSLHHYYLQLRQNLVSSPRFPPASKVEPVAFAFQSELGDWRPCQEAPRWAQSMNLGSALTIAHQALAGLGQNAARLGFIRALMPKYNMHNFGMTLRTKDEKDAPAWIGVTPKGIDVYQNGLGCYEIPESPKVTFLWANITKLYFERKKFEIRGQACPWGGSNQKLSFTAASESVPRHLLLLCRSTHQFHLSNHKLLLELGQGQKSGGSGGATGESSSCTSTLSSKNDEKMLDLSLWADGLLLAGESNEHQRVSVISNASSNTTSGIVSDRVYSLDGSEEDLDMREISDCCTEGTHNTDNSTSLESLSQKPPSRHHLSKKGTQDPKGTSETEPKYWYCDSDCEDCEDGPCRSLLVRTIGEKRACAGHCECNSCAADDELDGIDDPPVHQHNNTPSMASEMTLKAVELCVEDEVELKDIEDKVVKRKERFPDPKETEKDEHVYGEISEDPSPKTEEDREYSTIEQESGKGIGSKAGACRMGRVQQEKVKYDDSVRSGIVNGKIVDVRTNGLTPKVASLKSLRTQRILSQSNAEFCAGDYVEFGEKLQQGRYPSTRTVSDNFNTDSDYVQLPPLLPRMLPQKPPSKLWKLVAKTHKSSGNLSSSTTSVDFNNTLPKRRNDHEESHIRNLNKISSQSTIALNSGRKPEPPPKPPKNKNGQNTQAVDARFIATKPEILIQTAYATRAPIAIPSQAQILFRGSKVGVQTGSLNHSKSVDNIYDTVAGEEQCQPAPPPPPPYPKASTPLIIRPNNYIDVHASAVKNKSSSPTTTTTASNSLQVGAAKGGIGNRCGSVPNNLNNFFIGLQNLKPLSRSPIVHPAATSSLSLGANGNKRAVQPRVSPPHVPCPGPPPPPKKNSLTYPSSASNLSLSSGTPSRFTTVYTSQLTRSQIQQFKAQLYSDMDYVIFPPKDPRVSQQEYFDSKSLSYTTISSTANSNPLLNTTAACGYQLGDIPPPYLPPPPPYPADSKPQNSTTTTTSAKDVSPHQHMSYQSLYNLYSTNSQCSSSQYGYYDIGAISRDPESLHRFLSTQSLAGSNGYVSTPCPIYYPCSTQSAPPLPPYKKPSHIVVENGMRKAVQETLKGKLSEEKIRMKFCRSEESIYSIPSKDTEEKLQALYNLPPPPPYHKKPPTMMSPSDIDLNSLRARCAALELPLLRALCSEGSLLNQGKTKPKIRPTAHAHPKLAPKNLSLPQRPPKPAAPLPQQLPSINLSSK